MDEINLVFCKHLFQFINCQADLDWFIGLLVIDVKNFILYHTYPSKKKGSFCFMAEDPCGDDIQLYL
tara:strand:- start:186 stop:386 length:201 start_codon:yes stop_codon:yes gene_type:complete